MIKRFKSQFEVASVITKLREMRDDVEAIDHHVTEEVVREIDEVTKQIAELLKLVGKSTTQSP